MKTIILLCLSTLFLVSPSRADQPEWSQVPEILARIVPPKFPARDFVVTKFGAKPDGQTDCTTAIAKAIEACAQAGGGRRARGGSGGGIFDRRDPFEKQRRTASDLDKFRFEIQHRPKGLFAGGVHAV